MNQKIFYHAGRLIFASVFITAAITNLLNLSNVIANMEDAVPLAEVVVPSILIFELVSGILIAIDIRWSRKVAIGLGIYVLGLCFLFYPFWMFDGPQLIVQKNYFWKTLGLGGALFMYAGSRRPA